MSGGSSLMHAIVKARPSPGAEISTVDQRTVQEDEVIVKVKVASICGTDVHVWSWDKSMSDRIKKFPLVIGHEFCGVIVDVGKGVTSLQIGD
jgi:threonine 3-dehydrogenase